MQFPANLTGLQSANVSELHSRYTLLFAFANQELASAEVALIKANRKRAKREAAIFRANPHLSNQEKWKREATLSTHPAIEAIEDHLTILRAQVRFLVGLKENYDRLIATLSRELSRRQAFAGRPESYSV